MRFSMSRRMVTLQVEPVMCCTMTKNAAPNAIDTKNMKPTK